MNNLLTDKEQKVINALVEAWNSYLELPEIHQDHFNEFRDIIHKGQYMIMARPVMIQLNK